MADIQTVVFTDSLWHPLSLYTGSVVVTNKGGQPISIVINTTGVTPTDAQSIADGIDPIEIGGIRNEVRTLATEYVFGKAKNGSGSVQVRASTEIDPSEDVSSIANSLTQLLADLNGHTTNTDNPHNVTKTSVGLSNLPNAKSDNIELNDSEVLATAKAIFQLNTYLEEHKDATGNVHSLTKAQLGLEFTPNYPPATSLEAVDSDIDTALMTPKTTYESILHFSQASVDVPSQSVVNCQTKTRPSGWAIQDCSLPSNVILKQTATQIKVNSSLRVAYADNGKTRLSNFLTDAQYIDLPATPTDGLYLIYVNIDENSNFSSFGYTTNKYKEGMVRDSHVGDFYSIPKNTMYDSSDTIIRRVYIGKVYVISNEISVVISVPVGNEYILPAITPMDLGSRDMYDNPFMSEPEVYAEVEYTNDVWGKSGWNDQIGVLAHPLPSDRNHQLVLQAGLMGFIAAGQVAGSPFGANFASISSPVPKARLVLRKKY